MVICCSSKKQFYLYLYKQRGLHRNPSSPAMLKSSNTVRPCQQGNTLWVCICVHVCTDRSAGTLAGASLLNSPVGSVSYAVHMCIYVRQLTHIVVLGICICIARACAYVFRC